MAGKSKRVKARAAKEQTGAGASLRGILTGSAVGTLVFFMLLCFMALVSLKSGMKQAAFPYLGIAAGTGAAFFTGLVAVKQIGKNGLAMGGVAVLPLLTVVLLTVLFTGKSMGMMTLILAFAMIAASCAGGILAVNRR